MARKSDAESQLARQLVAAFLKLPWKARVAIVVVALVIGVGIYVAGRIPQAQPEQTTAPPVGPPPAEPPPAAEMVNVPPPAAAFPPGSKDVVFCAWNLENLFDDRDDRRNSTDEPYDNWFARDGATRDAKYQKIAEWLVRLNGGNGPDVFVGIEIESYRAAELLKDALNARLPAGAARYQYVAMEEVSAGRHIAPCVISRYPLGGAVLPNRVRRLLEVRVTANNHDLILVASHWTSQRTDRGDKEDGGRSKYAAEIAELYAAAIKANPAVDFLVCGDFNDTPQSDQVYKTLHMIGDSRLVTTGANPPRLFGLLSGKSPAEFGTHYYDGPLIYDQIGVSPGMLDASGWGYAPDSVRVPTDGLIRSGSRGRRPWRFGSATDDALGRGFSDHFPVVVTLKVAP
jgi:hypothetical protein